MKSEHTECRLYGDGGRDWNEVAKSKRCRQPPEAEKNKCIVVNHQLVTGMAAQDTNTLGLLHPFCNTIAKMQNPGHGMLDTPQVNAHLKLAFTDYT